MPKATWKAKHTNAINRRKAFIDHYFACGFNATEAARLSGSPDDSARNDGWSLLHEKEVKEEIQRRFDELHMSANETLKLLADIARGDLGDFLTVEKDGTFSLDLSAANGKTKLIKKIKNKKVIYSGTTVDREIHTEEIELYSALDALDKFLRVHGKYQDSLNIKTETVGDNKPFVLPADVIAPDFFGVYRDIKAGLHSIYDFDGGRGATKSTFIGDAIIMLLVNNPEGHFLALRQVAENLRTSVYRQLLWSVDSLGLSDKFKFTTSPMEATYLPTGQKIFMAGGNDPGKLKSIKPPFGYIMGLWFEEFDQFRGMDQVRNIIQSALRGGEKSIQFRSWNTPKTINHWVNKYLLIPDERRFHHHSTYLNVPVDWLGQPFIDEAEHLKAVNYPAYEHEYLGIANGLGGMVFDNVVLRKITDEEIAEFDRVAQGIDWGYFPDPFVWGRSHHDAARLKLYVFDEYWATKKSNRATYDYLYDPEKKDGKHAPKDELCVADSAEPKSIGDYRSYGANIRGAEKGPDSVNYSMKWLQSLAEIVIDPERAPHHAEEFTGYELEQDKDGNYISEYPDENNHCIDTQRYRTNLIWRKKGQ